MFDPNDFDDRKYFWQVHQNAQDVTNDVAPYLSDITSTDGHLRVSTSQLPYDEYTFKVVLVLTANTGASQNATANSTMTLTNATVPRVHIEKSAIN